MLTPADFGQSRSSSTYERFFLEVNPTVDEINGPEPLRLIYNKQLDHLQLVGQFYPQKADELWTNGWVLEAMVKEDDMAEEPEDEMEDLEPE